MKIMKMIAKFLLVVFVGGVLLTACERKGSVIAVVNGDNIYEIELNNMITGLYGTNASGVSDTEKESIYESLITAKLVEQDCKERGLSVSDKDIEAYIDEIVESQGLKSKSDFYKQLKDAYNYSESFIKSLIKNSLEEQKLHEAVINELVVEDETAVRNAYDQDPDKYKQVEVSHILVAVSGDVDDAAAKAKAEGLIRELALGKDFAALAKENSDDTGTAANGGLLSGYFGADNKTYVAEFVAASVKLGVGEYTKEPVKTEFGYHIIKVNGVKSSYEEVKDAVKESYYSQAQADAYDGYIKSLMEKAEIERKMNFDKTDAVINDAQSVIQ